MKYRKLGSTEIKVSEVGFGAWQLGAKLWGGSQGDEATRLVHRAIDGGCNFFDTAPNYGEGASEEILGKSLEGRRSKVVFVSKFGHNPDGPADFSVERLRFSVERSLKKLKTDYLDGVLLHNPNQNILAGNEGHYDVLEDLKKEGKIRSYGASVDSSDDLLTVMNNSESQIAEIYIHALHQEMVNGFDQAKAKNMGLIGKVPLDSGWLSGKYDENSIFTTGYRERWSEEIKKRRANYVKQLAFLITEDQTMAQGALRFLLAFEEISTIIPGAKNLNHLTNNLSASDGRLSDEHIGLIKKLWDEEIKTNPLPW